MRLAVSHHWTDAADETTNEILPRPDRHRDHFPKSVVIHVLSVHSLHSQALCFSFFFRAPATSPLSSSSCFSIDHPVINSRSFSFVSHTLPPRITPQPLLALQQKKARRTFKWTTRIFAFFHLPTPIFYTATFLSSASLFLSPILFPGSIPLWLFSCQWTDFFLCRGAAD